MSTTPFHIEPFRNCILVTLRGKWDMSTNIQYLAKLSDCLKTRKGRPFHLFVDMRSWQIPNSDTFNQIKAPIKLDRRSQLSETWLEDEATDADHIAEKFFSAPSIKLGFELERTQSIPEFITLCEEKADNVVIDYVRTWIG
ncbi:arginine decarboxylase [Alteromonas macleodii]|uniref:arginine decarboxylase n=1 Tax=Alteromonas macleodii TaxID=28108 RepID=UPI002FE10D7A